MDSSTALATESTFSALPGDSALTTVRLLEKADGRIVVGLGSTNYQLHLTATAPIAAATGHRVRGVIGLKVWKVDRLVNTGNFIEPIYGRPRRVQGHVAGAIGNSLVVKCCGCLMRCDLPERYAAGDFQVGEPLGLDILPGATFEPA